MTEIPEPTPEEQAANQAHTDVNEADATWGEKIEARLTALEDKVSGAASTTSADTTEATQAEGTTEAATTEEN